ncbi:hypothetical protein QNF09_004664 [Vibrio alginolyticus]|nr:hypothetical protein [Vibrio alginolyticus]
MNKSHKLLISTLLVILVSGCNSSGGKSTSNPIDSNPSNPSGGKSTSSPIDSNPSNPIDSNPSNPSGGKSTSSSIDSNPSNPSGGKSTSNPIDSNPSNPSGGKSTSIPIDSNPSNPNNSGPIVLKGNVFTVIEGFLEDANSSGMSTFSNYAKISTSNNFPLFQGSDIPSTPITLTTNSHQKSGPKGATIIIDNGDWHCYKATSLIAERNNNKIIVDGKIEEFSYNYRIQECGSNLISSYEFHNATMDDNLLLEQPNTAFLTGSSGVKMPLRTYEFLVNRYKEQLEGDFGPSWRAIQEPYIHDAANKAGNTMFVMDASGEIELSVTSKDIYDFNSLNKNDLLKGTLWGSPGASASSKNWCKIVNIPKGLSSSAIQYQTVIATNCARSTARYCDASKNDPSGIYPAVAPVSWDDTSKNNAQLNSDEQYSQNKQGHFVIRSAQQNVFLTEFKSAIIPIIGYTTPRNDGKANNAGVYSWAGHEGHCQNVMNTNHTKVGVASRDTQPKKSGIQSYWTQDFN